MHNNFCHHPWIGVDITAQGEFRPCCKYDGFTETSYPRSLQEYQASPEILQLKHDLLSGKRADGCRRCWADEDGGLLSKRQIDYAEIFKDKITSLDSYKILSITFGNSCNLTCRTCTSYYSSGWIVPETKLQTKFPAIEIYKHHKFYQDNKFIESILVSFKNVVQIDFAGGETFISGTKAHLEFLDYFIQQGADNISLRYVTNGTIFPNNEFWQRWKKFKSLEIQLSVDGTEQQFDYLRYPADWQTVLHNINLYKQQEITKLTVNHTISNLNVFYLPEFVIWCIKNKLGRPHFNLVEAPSHYNIKSLPGTIKQAVADKLLKYNLKNIVEYMNQEDLTSNFDFFLEWTDELDLQRNQSYFDIFPEFGKIINDYKNNH